MDKFYNQQKKALVIHQFNLLVNLAKSKSLRYAQILKSSFTRVNSGFKI